MLCSLVAIQITLTPLLPLDIVTEERAPKLRHNRHRQSQELLESQVASRALQTMSARRAAMSLERKRAAQEIDPREITVTTTKARLTVIPITVVAVTIPRPAQRKVGYRLTSSTDRSLLVSLAEAMSRPRKR
jgi:hypothetical protein